MSCRCGPVVVVEKRTAAARRGQLDFPLAKGTSPVLCSCYATPPDNRILPRALPSAPFFGVRSGGWVGLRISRRRSLHNLQEFGLREAEKGKACPGLSVEVHHRPQLSVPHLRCDNHRLHHHRRRFEASASSRDAHPISSREICAKPMTMMIRSSAVSSHPQIPSPHHLPGMNNLQNCGDG